MSKKGISFEIDADIGGESKPLRKPPSRFTTATRKTNATLSSDSNSMKFKEGDKVEANYKGLGKWLSARIKLIRPDGTYDLEYANGDSETKVNENKLNSAKEIPNQPKGKSGSHGRRVVLEEGMKVEGNYKGKGKWYPGKIMRVRADGTFDIDYADGEQETRVLEENIRVIGVDSDRLGSSGSHGRRVVLEEGMKVEGNYKGKGKWYP
eukprot:gene15899-21562_t